MNRFSPGDEVYVAHYYPDKKLAGEIVELIEKDIGNTWTVRNLIFDGYEVLDRIKEKWLRISHADILT